MEKDIESIKVFFSKAHSIYQQYADILSPNTYNIFSVLRVEEREVIHSNFLADLLNPKGKHGKGAVFLEIFLKQLSSPENILSSENINVLRECNHIDILIEAEDWAIMIENKIYHFDTEGQLLGYYKKLCSQIPHKKIFLLYLNLYGEKPNDISYTDKDNTLTLCVGDKLQENQILCISYAWTISGWISDCIKLLKDGDILIEILNQYNKMIEINTGSMNEELKDKLVALLLEEENIKLFSKLHEALVHRFETYVWTELKKGLTSKGICVEDKLENGVHYVKWCIDTFEGQAIYFFVFMNDGEDGNTVGIGFDYEKNEKLQKERTLAAIEQFQYKLVGAGKANNIHFSQITYDEKVEEAAVSGWIAAYNINEELNFDDFSNETLYNTEQRQGFINGLLDDIKIILEYYQKNQ
ncbi:MAG: PD-(D/E)XK nuclease family protein [Bacteroidia bacterium]